MSSQNKKNLGLNVTKDAHDLDGEHGKTGMMCIREALTRGQRSHSVFMVRKAHHYLHVHSSQTELRNLKWMPNLTC